MNKRERDKKEIEEIEAYIDLADFVKKTMQNEPSDMGCLDTLYKNQYSSDFINKVTSCKQLDTVCKSNKTYTPNVLRLVNSIKRCKRKTAIHRRVTATLLSGAAAAVIAISLYVLNYNKPSVETTPQVQIIKIDRPTLVTSDSRVELKGEKLVVETKQDIVADSSDAEEQTQKIKKQHIIVPSGFTYTVELPDGSCVTLNSMSELIYYEPFDISRRAVEIKGEAFFDIAKSETPFIVNFTNGEIKVYGTSFNVKMLEEGKVESVLVSGSVGVSYKGIKEVLLSPNERIVLDCDNGNYEIDNVNVENYISWRDNSFTYMNYDANQVIKDIEKWYNITINDPDNLLSHDLKVSINISRSASKRKMIIILEEALNIVIINEGNNQYTISK